MDSVREYLSLVVNLFEKMKETKSAIEKNLKDTKKFRDFVENTIEKLMEKDDEDFVKRVESRASFENIVSVDMFLTKHIDDLNKLIIYIDIQLLKFRLSLKDENVSHDLKFVMSCVRKLSWIQKSIYILFRSYDKNDEVDRIYQIMLSMNRVEDE